MSNPSTAKFIQCLLVYAFVNFHCHSSHAFVTKPPVNLSYPTRYLLHSTNHYRTSSNASLKRRKRQTWNHHLSTKTWHTPLFSTPTIRKPKEERVLDDNDDDENVPVNMKQAITRFFFHHDKGPLFITLSILATFLHRLYLHFEYTPTDAITPTDFLLFTTSILIWWIQEYFIHRQLLHSNFEWVGKTIHQQHHAKPYFHISIDPPALMWTWLLIMYLFVRLWIPSYPLSLSFIMGYAMAGIGYEWIHYLVHTKVPMKKYGYLETIRNLHVRHHLVSDDHYFSFTVPFMDDWMNTNPSSRVVVEKKKKILKQ